MEKVTLQDAAAIRTFTERELGEIEDRYGRLVDIEGDGCPVIDKEDLKALIQEAPLHFYRRMASSREIIGIFPWKRESDNMTLSVSIHLVDDENSRHNGQTCYGDCAMEDITYWQITKIEEKEAA